MTSFESKNSFFSNYNLSGLNQDMAVYIKERMGTNTDKILTYFKQLSDIPRGSFNLDGVRSFVSDWAKKHGFVYRRDTYGNIVVVVGPENQTRQNIIIQSHQDIVCEKSHDSKHDFAKDPIKLLIQGDKLVADGTTLGADNGLALVASMVLAEQVSKNAKFLEKATLYLLMTADEEIGLGGANNLGDYPFLPKTGYLLNVDSEVAGEVCGGSTGASDSHMTLEIKETPCDEKSFALKTWKLELRSFRGGHSGLDIHKGSANAIKVMAQILDEIRRTDQKFGLQSINGGKAHNAIPIGCIVEFHSEKGETDIKKVVETVLANVKETYGEDKAEYFLVPEKPVTFFTNTDKVIDLLLIVHHGIIHMNPFTTGCVYTSNNVGVVKTVQGKNEMKVLDINCLARSDSENHMRNIHNVLSVIAKSFGATMTPFECYNGWSPVWSKSKTLTALKQAYKDLNGKEPRVYSVHAGTECSEICKKYPLWDAQSIGPQINNAHTPAENLIISSVEPFYDWMYQAVLILGTA